MGLDQRSVQFLAMALRILGQLKRAGGQRIVQRINDVIVDGTLFFQEILQRGVESKCNKQQTKNVKNDRFL